jgi:hypothetical protein
MADGAGPLPLGTQLASLADGEVPSSSDQRAGVEPDARKGNCAAADRLPAWSYAHTRTVFGPDALKVIDLETMAPAVAVAGSSSGPGVSLFTDHE